MQEKYKSANYSENFVLKQLKKAKSNTVAEKREESATCTAIPYLGPETYAIKRILEKNGIRTFFSMPPNLKTLTQPIQNRKPKLELRNCIYKVPCTNCEKCYIGQSQHPLQHRFKQHKDDIKNFNQSNAISIHHIETGHQPNWEAFEILYREEKWQNRLAIETAAILENQPNTMNQHPGFYTGIKQILPHHTPWFSSGVRQTLQNHQEREPPSTKADDTKRVQQTVIQIV
jgi:hypothetical protein